MYSKPVINSKSVYRYPIAIPSTKQEGGTAQKSFVRVGFSGPCKKLYDREQMVLSIKDCIKLVEHRINKTEEEILICAGGTKSGFHNEVYNIAYELGLKTSAYLTGRVFIKTYQFFPVDEKVLALPLDLSQAPSWDDCSELFIADCDYHFAMTTPNTEKDITFKEFILAQERMKNEPESFYSQMVHTPTWE